MVVLKVKGFTLVELLVVIVLIGLMTSFVMLSTGSAGLEREMAEEAKRLHGLVKLAQEESIIQAKEIAMEMDKNEYSFLQQGDKKWVPLNEKVFRQRNLKNELELKLDMEAQPGIFKSDKTDVLRIYFLSSGELTPFTISIKLKEHDYPYYRLTGEFNGTVELKYISDPLNN